MRLKPKVPLKQVAIGPECVMTGDLKVHPSLKRYMGYALFKAALRMRAEMGENLIHYRILPAHYGIIRVLEESGPMNQATLGDSLGIDKATMVKLIDALEEVKYLKRTTSSEDRRAKLISLTEKGTNVLEKLAAAAATAEDNFLAPLSPAERKAFASILDKLISK